MLIKYSHFCDADLQHNCEFDRQQSSYHCVYMGFVSPSMDFVIYPTIRPQYAAMRFGAETTLTSETCRCRLVEGNARDSRMVDSLQGAFHFTHQQSSPAHRVSATTALPPSAFLRRHLQGYRSWNPGVLGHSTRELEMTVLFTMNFLHNTQARSALSSAGMAQQTLYI